MKIIGANSITGAVGSLDKIPDIHLVDGDMALVKDGLYMYMYRLDDDSGIPQNLPDVVAPLDTPESYKRWLLQGMYVNSISADSLSVNTISSSGDISISDPVVIGSTLSVSDQGTFSTPTLPPFNITSTARVDNLNVELFDGKTSDQYLTNISGVVAIPDAVSSITVGLPDEQPDTSYAVYVQLMNVADPSPSIYGNIISERHTDSFAVKFSGLMDSANYVLEWTIF